MRIGHFCVHNLQSSDLTMKKLSSASVWLSVSRYKKWKNPDICTSVETSSNVRQVMFLCMKYTYIYIWSVSFLFLVSIFSLLRLTSNYYNISSFFFFIHLTEDFALLLSVLMLLWVYNLAFFLYISRLFCYKCFTITLTVTVRVVKFKV